MAEEKRQEITRLIMRGLNHYGLGEVRAAVDCWERVLAIDPENGAARDYLETAYDELADERKPAPAAARAQQAAGAASATPAKPPAPARSAHLENTAGDDDSTPRTEPPVQFSARAKVAVSNPEPLSVVDDEVKRALDAYRAGDLETAWELLRRVGAREPQRLDVQGYLTMVRNDRAQAFARAIGDQGRTLARAVSMHELMKRKLSPEEGFLLSQIDGSLSIEQLLSMASTDRVRALEIVARFLREGLVA